jgi:hypothetical protein
MTKVAVSAGVGPRTDTAGFTDLTDHKPIEPGG